jgi:hypothetical protein
MEQSKATTPDVDSERRYTDSVRKALAVNYHKELEEKITNAPNMANSLPFTYFQRL